MKKLWEQFDRIVIFDTETTGIEFGKDRIIELGAVSLENGEEIACMDDLIRLPEGQMLPPFIVELTGITDEQLLREGVEQNVAVGHFCQLLEGAKRPLLVAYNAQFDLNFLYHFLRPFERVEVLRAPKFLDALTVYKDRRDYPHKLANAIEAYFRDESNLLELAALKEVGVVPTWSDEKTEGIFSGQSVVLTGTLANFKRSEAQKLIEARGGVCQSSVTAKTTLVLAGEEAGSKLAKAQKLGIKIITEDEFKKMLENE